VVRADTARRAPLHGERMSKGARLRNERRVQLQPRSRRGGTSSLRLPLVAGAALFLATALIAISVVSTRDDGVAAPDAALDGTVTANLFAGIPQDGVALGRADAPVTLVEFADFQCPFCAAFSRDALPELVQAYVRTGKVRIELRPLAFIGPDSTKARELALGAGEQNRLWQVAHLLFEHQGAENSGWLTSERVTAITRAVPGLDAERSRAASRGKALHAQVAAAEADAARHGISSTPSFLAGRTGGELERLELESIGAGALRPTIDRLLAG
jgi:protein-disulfide isomerase